MDTLRLRLRERTDLLPEAVHDADGEVDALLLADAVYVSLIVNVKDVDREAELVKDMELDRLGKAVQVGLGLRVRDPVDLDADVDLPDSLHVELPVGEPMDGVGVTVLVQDSEKVPLPLRVAALERLVVRVRSRLLVGDMVEV